MSNYFIPYLVYIMFTTVLLTFYLSKICICIYEEKIILEQFENLKLL